MSERNRTPKQQRSILRRQQIIDAARQIIQKKGYANLTISEIAEVAGLTASSMYQYFRNKSEIMLAINQQSSDEFNQLMQHLFSQPVLEQQAFTPLLLKLIDQLYLFYRQDPVLHDIMLAGATDKEMQQFERQDFDNAQQFLQCPHFPSSCHDELCRTLDLLSRFAMSGIYHALEQNEPTGQKTVATAKQLIRDSWLAFLARHG